MMESKPAGPVLVVGRGLQRRRTDGTVSKWAYYLLLAAALVYAAYEWLSWLVSRAIASMFAGLLQ